MTKTTIELNRLKGHWSNWGRMYEKYDGNDAPSILDALIEWSRANPAAKVYRHNHWRTEENKATDPIKVVTSSDPDYLDIYWQ